VIAYLTAIATLVGVRALVTLGLNVQWGMTGLVNLGAVAFFAIGAYTSALLAVGGVSLVFAWPAAVGLATAAGAGAIQAQPSTAISAAVRASLVPDVACVRSM